MKPDGTWSIAPKDPKENHPWYEFVHKKTGPRVFAVGQPDANGSRAWKTAAAPSWDPKALEQVCKNVLEKLPNGELCFDDRVSDPVPAPC